MSKLGGLASTIKTMLLAAATGGIFYLIIVNLDEKSYANTVTVFNAIKYLGCIGFFIFFKPLMEHFLKGKDNMAEYKASMIKVRNKMVAVFVFLELSTLLFSYLGAL
ncbi:hypothetical protein [Motilimonas eburnea]|uniref:hypothetical protein n=1 Tax=Motilimonas eburnea TaxID=1737488 RepID=UPI001E425B60|nr:hypothetical protein [Motilimonas eburnea]MCE2573862.1 hypothetical protein [Motilimonas eburnea]